MLVVFFLAEGVGINLMFSTSPAVASGDCEDDMCAEVTNTEDPNDGACLAWYMIEYGIPGFNCDAGSPCTITTCMGEIPPSEN